VNWLAEKSDIPIAIRNLLKRQEYSEENIIGLAIGMACCLLKTSKILP
jgi:hypothetical protein